MKKTYIIPSSIAVELRCKNYMLEGSLPVDESVVTGNSAGWTKEYNNTFPNKSVWDEEW